MRAVALILLIALGPTLRAADALPPGASPILEPTKEGQEMAARLRSSGPEENSEFSGVLEITEKDGRQRFVPIVSKITVATNHWQVVYQSMPTNGAPAETLIIVHSPGESNRHTFAVSGATNTAARLTQAFADSDFWLMDLGLEFFHWPQQRALRAEMMRTRPCRVLESATAHPVANGYSRVLSWIDNETGGVLQAEAYDQQGKLLKKFSLGPIQKVQGQWRLREMRIRNTQTRQQTELKFDLKE